MTSMKFDELLARARRLEMKTRHLVRSQYAGLYRSAFRGQGMEFAEVREYSEGDDVRLIDWNVSARSQALYVKRMAEERERNILVILDATGSLRFGSVHRTKFDLLVELAALLVLSGFYSKDRVSLAVIRTSVELYVPAAKGWNHAARLIREMVSFRPEGSAKDLEPLWNFLISPGVPKGLVVFLTDFQAPFVPSRSFSSACRKHEVVVALVSDPREWRLPDVGRVRLRNPESGETQLIDSGNPGVRRDFEENAARRREELEALFRRSGIDWVECSTASGYESSLRGFLERRASGVLRRAGRVRSHDSRLVTRNS